MSELLVMSYDKSNKVPAVDLMCWKKGMTIAVKPDGWTWSHTELISYKIIKMKGVPEKDLTKYMQKQYDTTSGDWEDNDSVQYRRRRYVIDVENWTAADDTYVEAALTASSLKLARLDSKTDDKKSGGVTP